MAEHPASPAPQPPPAKKGASSHTFLWMAAAGLTLRLASAPWTAHSVDMGTFVGWGRQLAQVGLPDFYSPDRWCDYFPGYLYILWLIGHVNVGGWLERVLFKLPAMLADIATAAIIWRTLRTSRPRLRFAATTVYLFNPAVLLNSTFWGQVDGFHALFIIWGLSLLSGGMTLRAAAAFGYAVAIKPHAAAVLPLAAVYAWRKGTRWRGILAALLIVGLVFAATFLPFAGGSPTKTISLIRDRFVQTAGQYQYATINAMNLWYLAGLNFKPDGTPAWWGMSPANWAVILVAVCGAVLIVWMIRRPGRVTLWSASGMMFLALFLFVTRAHERHLFPALAILTVAAGWRPKLTAPLVVLSATYVVNALLSLRYLDPRYRSAQLCDPVIADAICIVNLAMLIVIPILLWRTPRTGDADEQA